jgi:hypothetical protein
VELAAGALVALSVADVARAGVRLPRAGVLLYG